MVGPDHFSFCREVIAMRNAMTPPAELHPDDGNLSVVPLDRPTLQKLGRAKPYKLLGHVALEWALIIAASGLAVTCDRLWLSALAIAFIATRQHALLILMHEFTHRQFSRTRPVLNDVLGDFLTALPFMLTIYGYRRDHLQHHRATSTDADPNWSVFIKQGRYQFPRSRASIVWLLFLHCIGVFGFREFKVALLDSKMAVDTPRSTQFRQLLFAAIVVVAATCLHGWLIVGLYWFLPMFSVLIALMYVRDIGEHFAMPGPGWNFTRTTLVGWAEGFFISPYNVNFHAEHHMYPVVSASELPGLHRALMENPVYAKRAVISKGYLSGVLRDATENRSQHLHRSAT